PLPSPYADSGDETGPEVPAMQPELMVAAAVAGLSAFESLEPDAVVDAWESMLVFEPDCPEQQLLTMEGGLTVIDWGTEGCTTSAGLTIRGAGHLERTATDEGGRTTQGAVLYSEAGTMRLSTADGRFLEMNGYLGWERGTSLEGTDAYFEVGGELSADPATAAASPLLDPEVRAQGFLFSFAGEGYQALGGSGSVSGPALGEALAFQFTDLLVVPQACATEPAATLSIRDDEGYWHDIVFDAATLVDGAEPVFEPDRCDGCGTYVVAGAVLGDACISPAQVSGLMDWGDYPW
ncbi:MAG: hypothetical protein AB1Z98_08440, partial [Nannocystaceae bacterium]